ncbi:hypothetical protein Bca52824_082206 [Brassica carinata]|uniref:Uncharacterized protein n=1 Tax=Brassica carinata TaxID=52824 RepID=A0A8X7PIS3_BRACI|nr:hypothetical protein Bca52824_082206 [Brassica carinata]
MGSNMYPSASATLLGNHKDEILASPEHKYNIVKKLQELKHICRMTGDGYSYFEESQYWYRASDIVLTEP